MRKGWGVLFYIFFFFLFDLSLNVFTVLDYSVLTICFCSLLVSSFSYSSNCPVFSPSYFLSLSSSVSSLMFYHYPFHFLTNCFFTAWCSLFILFISFCFCSLISLSKLISFLTSSPLHLNIPSSQDPTAMSSASGVDHAVIGGVVAVIVFILLCLLIIFGRYLIRHKGQLPTQSHIHAFMSIVQNTPT